MRRRHLPPSALTDIAFLLLLFFLILSITTRQLPVDVDPALTTETEQGWEELPLLLMSREGELYLQGKKISLEDIPSENAYSLMADRGTRFSAMYPLIEYLREQEVTTLHCVVEEEQ